MLTLDEIIEEYMIRQPSTTITNHIVQRCVGMNYSDMDEWLQDFLKGEAHHNDQIG